VIGTSGSISLPADGKYDHFNLCSDRSEDGVVGIYDAVGVRQEILGVLKPGLTEARINIDDDAS
jgi:hypothetical protein